MPELAPVHSVCFCRPVLNVKPHTNTTRSLVLFLLFSLLVLLPLHPLPQLLSPGRVQLSGSSLCAHVAACIVAGACLGRGWSHYTVAFLFLSEPSFLPGEVPCLPAAFLFFLRQGSKCILHGMPFPSCVKRSGLSQHSVTLCLGQTPPCECSLSQMLVV